MQRVYTWQIWPHLNMLKLEVELTLQVGTFSYAESLEYAITHYTSIPTQLVNSAKRNLPGPNHALSLCLAHLQYTDNNTELPLMAVTKIIEIIYMTSFEDLHELYKHCASISNIQADDNLDEV